MSNAVYHITVSWKGFCHLPSNITHGLKYIFRFMDIIVTFCTLGFILMSWQHCQFNHYILTPTICCEYLGFVVGFPRGFWCRGLSTGHMYLSILENFILILLPNMPPAFRKSIDQLAFGKSGIRLSFRHQWYTHSNWYIKQGIVQHWHLLHPPPVTSDFAYFPLSTEYQSVSTQFHPV